MLCSDDDMSFMFAFFLIVMVDHVELIMQSTDVPNVEYAIVIPDVDTKFNPDVER